MKNPYKEPEDFKREEKEIIELVSSALATQKEREKKYYQKLKAPQYSRPGYRIWWVLAPFLMIAIALMILTLLPSYIPTLDQIDSQISSIEDTLYLVEPDQQKLASTDIDEQLNEIEEELKTLKEEENG